MSVAVVLAGLAAVLFGTGTALQAHAADTERPERLLEHRALARLAARPRWLAGTALDGLGALVHLAALHEGPLALVQPITLTAVVVAVPVAAGLRRRRPGGRQLLAAAETSAGLALLAGWCGRHLGHTAPAPAAMVVVPLLLAAGIVAAVVRASRPGSRTSQALLLGAAAGTAYGLSDALARTVQVTTLVPLLSLPRLVMLVGAVAVGAAGLVLTQLALQRSHLSASLPAQDSLALVVSVGLGAVLLGEVPRTDPWHLLVAVLALALAGHGVRTLARLTDRVVPAPVVGPVPVRG